MTINKEKKKEIVKQFRENLAKQKGVFFINFKGMKGESAHSLRSELHKSEAKMMVARKTLAKIAFKEEGIDFDPQSFDGEVGFIFSYQDGVGTAKIVNKFAKDEAIVILGGFFENSVISFEEVKSLAELPSREVLMAKLLGTMAAPMKNLLYVLEGNTRGLLYVLANAKKEN